MTTTVTIRHEGPGLHDIRIEALGNSQPPGIHFLTEPGQEFTGYFWTGGAFVVTEVNDDSKQQ